MEGRRKFRREGEGKRRDQLIAAALDIIARDGPQAATVRAIAERAGVTQGLIRHYFTSKEELTRAAYQQVMGRMTGDNRAALADAADQPEARLAAFVDAALRAPVVDPTTLGLWCAFIQQVLHDPAMAAVHEATYLGYRAILEELIAAALPRVNDPVRLRRLAIACNGVIDGLWLEGSAYPQGFADGELARIGLDAVGAMLDLDLGGHAPAGPAQGLPA